MFKQLLETTFIYYLYEYLGWKNWDENFQQKLECSLFKKKKSIVEISQRNNFNWRKKIPFKENTLV